MSEKPTPECLDDALLDELRFRLTTEIQRRQSFFALVGIYLVVLSGLAALLNVVFAGLPTPPPFSGPFVLLYLILLVAIGLLADGIWKLYKAFVAKGHSYPALFRELQDYLKKYEEFKGKECDLSDEFKRSLVAAYSDSADGYALINNYKLGKVSTLPPRLLGAFALILIALGISAFLRSDPHVFVTVEDRRKNMEAKMSDTNDSLNQAPQEKPAAQPSQQAPVRPMNMQVMENGLKPGEVRPAAPVRPANRIVKESEGEQ